MSAWRGCRSRRCVGADDGKRVNGRKRHVVVDMLGLLLGVMVTAADVGARAAAQVLLAQVAPGTTAVLERFELIVDGIELVHGYTGETDRNAFTERAKAVGLYDDEQQLAQEAVEAGRYAVGRFPGSEVAARRCAAVRKFASPAATWGIWCAGCPH
ncbi:transposase [Streptomyces sp. CB01580]|uniref:transposase n=1 Tax=Streptomyces sp. CB01580 TaxID=1703933 RepID=UPI000B1100EB